MESDSRQTELLEQLVQCGERLARAQAGANLTVARIASIGARRPKRRLAAALRGELGPDKYKLAMEYIEQHLKDLQQLTALAESHTLSASAIADQMDGAVEELIPELK